MLRRSKPSEPHHFEVAYDVCADLTQLYQSSQLSGSNAAFVEELYEAYLADPASVPARWRSYFDTLQSQGAPDIAHGPVLQRIGEMSRQGRRLVLSAAVGEVHSVDQAKQGAVLKLINAYRTRGHLAANLDPKPAPKKKG